MKVLRNLPARRNKNGKFKSWAIFWCEGCLQEVEKPLSNGLRDNSCGCKQHTENIANTANYRHGGSYTKLYHVWSNMKDRCLNPNNKDYKDYGSRGITICPEWTDKQNGYISFRDWALNNGYVDNLQINRINNNGNYEPSNCNFITAKENLRNRRTVKLTLEKANEIRDLYETGNFTYKQLAEKYNISQMSVSYIINNKTWRFE